MIPLPAAAVVENRLAAVLRLYREKPICDFSNRSVPIDRFKCPVRSAAKRRRQTIRSVLVGVEPLRLFAGIAFRGRIRFVASDSLDASSVRSAGLNLDSTVQAAQYASGLMPA